MFKDRKSIICKLAEVINSLQFDHPIRVGIDGGGAAGKTTFANELVEPLKALNRPVIRSTIDGFHNPPEIRRKQGKLSPKGYYEDSYNYPELTKHLLEPLGPNGNLEYKESVYNFRINSPTNVNIQKADKNAVLIFEGIFLFNEILNSYWDYKIYIDTSFEITMQRAIIRDNNLFGGKEKTIELYQQRYIPGQEMYIRKCNPLFKANVIINNNDFLNPKVVKMEN